MSPERATSSGHGLEADWWALGILVLEMLTAKIPFGKTADGTVVAEVELYRQISEYDGAVDLSGALPCPDGDTQLCKNFIGELLCPNAADRLGSGSISSVMEHPFFCSKKKEHVSLIAVKKHIVLSPLKTATEAAYEAIVSGAVTALLPKPLFGEPYTAGAADPFSSWCLSEKI